MILAAQAVSFHQTGLRQLSTFTAEADTASMHTPCPQGTSYGRAENEENGALADGTSSVAFSYDSSGTYSQRQLLQAQSPWPAAPPLPPSPTDGSGEWVATLDWSLALSSSTTTMPVANINQLLIKLAASVSGGAALYGPVSVSSLAPAPPSPPPSPGEQGRVGRVARACMW
jgi:hypothetical protein